MLGKRDILVSLIHTLRVQQGQLRQQLLEAIQRLQDSMTASMNCPDSPKNMEITECTQALAGAVSQIRARLQDNHHALVLVEGMLIDYDTIEVPHLKSADLIQPEAPTCNSGIVSGGRDKRRRWFAFLASFSPYV